MSRRFLLPLLPLLLAAGFFASATVLVGCSSSPEVPKTEGVTNFDPSDVEMPEPVTTYGLWFFSGNTEAVDYASTQAALQARQQAYAAVQGIRYSYLMIAGDDAPTIRVEDLTAAGQVEGTEIQRKDWLDARDNTRHYITVQATTPVRSQITRGAAQAFTSGEGFSGTVELPVEAWGRPLTAHWAAIDQALRYRYGTEPGTYSGRIFIVRCEPRINRPDGASNMQAWEDGNGRSSSAAGESKLVFDVEVVLSDASGTTMPTIRMKELARLLTPPQPPLEVREAELDSDQQ